MPNIYSTPISSVLSRLGLLSVASRIKYKLAALLSLLLLSFWAHRHKAAGMKIKASKNKNNDHDGVSHGVKCSQEGDRIAALESNGQSLEQEHRLSCVFRGCSDASANFLDQLNGELVPGASILNYYYYYYYYYYYAVESFTEWRIASKYT